MNKRPNMLRDLSTGTLEYLCMELKRAIRPQPEAVVLVIFHGGNRAEFICPTADPGLAPQAIGGMLQKVAESVIAGDGMPLGNHGRVIQGE